MKRNFGFILSLVIGAAMLAACGSAATIGPTTNLNQTPTPTGVVVPGGTSKKGNFSLQISMEGVFNIPDFVTGMYGPDKAVIPLELKQNTYEGSYEGEFHAQMTGECNATATYPVTFQVTAKDKAPNKLNFTVKSSLAILGVLTCEDQSGTVNKPPMKGTMTFTLPAVDGASYVWNAPKSDYGSLTYTFTLKKQ